MAEETQATTEEPKRSVRQLTGWHLIAVEVLAFITRMWCRSLRMQADEETRQVMLSPGPTLFVLWHNRLFAIGDAHYRFRKRILKKPIYGLISASKDGAWLTGFFERIGIQAVRGSSSWRGTQAVRESIKVLKDSELGITPDGPRGPCYDFKSGAALLARKADCQVILMSLNYGASKRLKSWDQFYIPMPFSKVEFVARRAQIEASGPLEPLAEDLKRQLTAITRDR